MSPPDFEYPSGFGRDDLGNPLAAKALVRLLQIPDRVLADLDKQAGAPRGFNAGTITMERQTRGLRVYTAFGESDDARWLTETSNGVDGAGVGWEGARAAVPVLLPALLDKLLVNLSRDPSAAKALLSRVAFFANKAQSDEQFLANVVTLCGVDEEDDELAEALARGPSLGRGILSWGLQNGAYKSLADVLVEAELLVDSARLAAKTKVRPRRRTNERVAELSFWACWDWCWIVARGNRIIIKATIECIVNQCSIYTRRGLPGLTDLGAAPYEAACSVGALRRILRLPE